MYGGGSDIALGEAIAKLPHNLCRPHAVQGVPGGLEAHRGVKVIAQRHGDLLHRQFITTDKGTGATHPAPRTLGTVKSSSAAGGIDVEAWETKMPAASAAT